MHQPLSKTTIVFHWLIAAGIIAMLAFGLVISNTPSGPDKTALIQIHKSFGMILGALALARIIVRMREGWPRPVAPLASWEERSSRAVHTLMLAATVVMPVTGILKSITYGRPVDVFGLRVIPPLLLEKNESLNELASIAHASVGFMLMALIAVHVIAALKHHFVNRDATLTRMAGMNGGVRA